MIAQVVIKRKRPPVKKGTTITWKAAKEDKYLTRGTIVKVVDDSNAKFQTLLVEVKAKDRIYKV